MKRKTSYEWLIEDCRLVPDDEGGLETEIIDNDHCDPGSLTQFLTANLNPSQLRPSDPTTFMQLALVQEIHDDETEDMLSRAWAYVGWDGTFHTQLCEAGATMGAKVPLRFVDEMARNVDAVRRLLAWRAEPLPPLVEHNADADREAR